jgi:hypothetical protein
MLDLFHIPTPQTANYQEFYGGDSSAATQTRTWVKPRGVSMVRFMLIGSGGNGGNGSSSAGGGGGGSGAVTSWIGPAIFIPDSLIVNISRGSVGNTSIKYLSKNGENTLLSADGGGGGLTSTGGTGATAMTANQFTASGIFTSVAGQTGAAGSATGGGSNISGSNTTFLSGGGGGAGSAAGTGGRVTPNYGYPGLPNTTAGGSVAGANGYFITQPILVGCGGAGGTTSTSVGRGGGRGGLGCGGGGSGEDGNAGGQGGNGAVFIWAW